MLDKDTQKRLTDLMQNRFTDLDIERDEPFKFRMGKWMLVLETVRLLEHHHFLTEMLFLIEKYKMIFSNIDFLAANTFEDKNVINKLISQVAVYNTTKDYNRFIKDAVKFVSKWGYVSKIKGEKITQYKHRPRKAKKIISKMTPDMFIYCLFLCFVRNYDIVKKNTLGFLSLFVPEVTPTGTSSHRSKKEVPQMPKYSASPYPESVLNIFAEQSKMQ